MTKNELANIINCKAERVCRIIETNYKLDLFENEIYDNRNRTESWMYEGSQNFIPENNLEYTYVLYCNDVNCHKVDYNNIDECNILGCEGCNSEGEVLIPASTKMKVISGENEADYEELGYYVIELEIID